PGQEPVPRPRLDQLPAARAGCARRGARPGRLRAGEPQGDRRIGCRGRQQPAGAFSPPAGMRTDLSPESAIGQSAAYVTGTVSLLSRFPDGVRRIETKETPSPSRDRLEQKIASGTAPSCSGPTRMRSPAAVYRFFQRADSAAPSVRSVVLTLVLSAV